MQKDLHHLQSHGPGLQAITAAAPDRLEVANGGHSCMLLSLFFIHMNRSAKQFVPDKTTQL